MKAQLSIRLKKARKKNNLTLDEAAEIVEISKSVISDIEEGKRKATNRELKAFAEIYGISVDDLIKASTNEKDSDAVGRIRL